MLQRELRSVTYNMQRNTEQGFVLVYTLVLLVTVLSVSGTILTIYLKELKLSTVGRESMVAYYAAESGAECAFYWLLRGANYNLNGPLTALYDDDANPLTAPASMPATCLGVQPTVSGRSFTWYAYPGDVSKPCATVEVVYTPGVPTSIRARGYNICTNAVGQVERGFELTY